MTGYLRTRVHKQQIISLYSETVLKFYNLEARVKTYYLSKTTFVARCSSLDIIPVEIKQTRSNAPQDKAPNTAELKINEIYTDYVMCLVIYSKTCVKWPLKNRQNNDLNDI